MIDLVSDTATKPTEGMRAAIAAAEVGDEQRGEDPSVNALCGRVADMLGFEAAILLPSGIMSNLVSVLVHCRPGDEIIAAANAHIVGSEGAGASALGGVQIRTIETPDGRFTAEAVRQRIRPAKARSPRTRVVWIEQTSNAGGGTVWRNETLDEIADVARESQCVMHMDGARLLNACVASNLKPDAYTRKFDSAWLDLSKGLGCPVGSVLAGSRSFIDEAWVWKHRLGGAMRQAGIIAAAGLYALDHHVQRLADDHVNARSLAAGLSQIEGVTIIGEGVETNLVFIDVSRTSRTAAEISEALIAREVRIGVADKYRMRAVTHLGIGRTDVQAVVEAFRSVITAGSTQKEKTHA